MMGRCGWVICGRYGYPKWNIESFWTRNNGSYGVRKSNNG